MITALTNYLDLKSYEKNTYKAVHKTIDKLGMDFEFIEYDNKTYKLLHKTCGSQFIINYSTLSNRIQANCILCTSCNPTSNKNFGSTLGHEYSLLLQYYQKVTIHHKLCNKIFKSTTASIQRRIEGGYEICTNCLPIIYKGANRAPQKYKILKTNNAIKTCIHEECGNTFEIYEDLYHSRRRNNHVICPLCNPPLTRRSLEESLPNGYLIKERKCKGKYTLQHLKCDSIFIIPRKVYTRRLLRDEIICLNCNPYCKQMSFEEKHLEKFISSIYIGDIITNTKSIIYPYEIDIYIPQLKLAIEFNGTYYHAHKSIYAATDVVCGKPAYIIWQKDEKKRVLLEKLGISLIVVWEQDWTNNQDGVKQMISSRFPNLT